MTFPSSVQLIEIEEKATIANEDRDCKFGGVGARLDRMSEELGEYSERVASGLEAADKFRRGGDD